MGLCLFYTLFLLILASFIHATLLVLKFGIGTKGVDVMTSLLSRQDTAMVTPATVKYTHIVDKRG